MLSRYTPSHYECLLQHKLGSHDALHSSTDADQLQATRGEEGGIVCTLRNGYLRHPVRCAQQVLFIHTTVQSNVGVLVYTRSKRCDTHREYTELLASTSPALQAQVLQWLNRDTSIHHRSASWKLHCESYTNRDSKPGEKSCFGPLTK